MDEFDREECMNPENKPYHHEGCPYNEECAVRNSIDKKNVIKGLEVCVDRDPGKYTCDQCPYENDGNDCEIHLTHDALELLKEQETDIGNLNETVKNLFNAYTEIKAIYGDSVRVVGELVRCKNCKHGRQYDTNAVDCEYRELATEPDWFCADGERKEGR